MGWGAGWGKHIWSCLLPLTATTIGFHSSADCQVKYSVGSLVNADLTRRGPLSVCVYVCVVGRGGLRGKITPLTTMISATQSIKNASLHQQPKHLKSTKAILILKRGFA